MGAENSKTADPRPHNEQQERSEVYTDAISLHKDRSRNWTHTKKSQSHFISTRKELHFSLETNWADDTDSTFATMDPERKDNIEKIASFMKNIMRKEDLPTLLSNQVYWQEFVKEANLNKTEEGILQKYLSRPEENTGVESKAAFQQEEKNRIYFLREFPTVQNLLQQHIARLHELADKADKVHKDCTISNLVASSTGIVSAVITITGGVLAPFTFGASLIAVGAGLGLGTAATVTGVTTNIVEHANMSSIQSEANELVSDGFKSVRKALEALGDYRAQCPVIVKSLADVKQLARNIRDLKLAKDGELLAKEILVQGGKVVQGAAIARAAFIMSRGLRIAGIATSGIFLLVDVANIVQQSIDMHKGAKTTSAKVMREEAEKLEKMLRELKGTYESLK